MKDPAFLFYSSDFLTGTMIMPFEDRGKYITILSYMHQNGRLSEETIRLLVGNVSDMLRLKFSIDKKGFWFNERLEIEIEKRRNFIESRHENGKKGGRPPKTDKKKLTYRLILAKPKDNLIINEDINTIDNEKENIIKESSLKILTDFNFTETKNFNKLRQISDFVRKLISENRFDYFIEQYPAYWKYKELSLAEKQSLDTFLNEGWDREVWTEKLKQYKNGKQQKPDISNLTNLTDKILANAGINISGTNTEK